MYGTNESHGPNHGPWTPPPPAPQPLPPQAQHQNHPRPHPHNHPSHPPYVPPPYQHPHHHLPPEVIIDDIPAAGTSGRDRLPRNSRNLSKLAGPRPPSGGLFALGRPRELVSFLPAPRDPAERQRERDLPSRSTALVIRVHRSDVPSENVGLQGACSGSET